MDAVEASVERIFVGWHRPGLEAAIDALWQRFPPDREAGRWDLASATIVIPGRRAARQLLRRLVERAEVDDLYLEVPRQILTPGGLLDMLCPPARTVPGELTRQLFWAEALREWHETYAGPGRQPGREEGGQSSGPSEAHTSGGLGGTASAESDDNGCPLLRFPPAHDDIVGWLRVAERVARVHSLLAPYGLTFRRACERLAHWPGGFPDEDRWCALAEVERDYIARIEDAGYADRDLERLRLLGMPNGIASEQAVPSLELVGVHAGRDAEVIVLVGIVEVPPVLQRALAVWPGRVMSMIHAPESNALPDCVGDGDGDGDGDDARTLTRRWMGDSRSRADHLRENMDQSHVGSAARGDATDLKESPSLTPAAPASSSASSSSSSSASSSASSPNAESAPAARLFDAYGGINSQYWRTAEVSIGQSQFAVVEKPVDQADLALSIIEQHNGDLAGHEILNVAPDAELIPTLARQARLAGADIRNAAGRPIEQTSVAKLLAALREFLDQRTAAALHALLRHPDIEHYVARQLPKLVRSNEGHNDSRSLPGGGTATADEGRADAHAVRAELDALLAPDADHEPEVHDGAQVTSIVRSARDESEAASVGSNALLPRGIDAGQYADLLAEFDLESNQPGPAWWLGWFDAWVQERFPDRLDRDPLNWPGVAAALRKASRTNEPSDTKADEDDNDGNMDGRTAAVVWSVGAIIMDLLHSLADDDARPLESRADSVAEVLANLYSGQTKKRTRGPHAEFIAACQAIQGAVQDLIALAELPAVRSGDVGADLLETTGAETIELIEMQLRGTRIPPLPDENAIEAVGWLEAPHDDASLVIVTGFNEGFLPEAIRPDPILPDQLRQFLGISSSTTRFARDVFLTNMLIHSRPHVYFVGGRLSRDGDPLRPSRLLFNGPHATVIERIRRSLPGAASNTSVSAVGAESSGGGRGQQTRMP
ncbi:MAG: hypothetical protein ACOC0P_02945, partial [Planctomycetota bacterium]